MRAPIRAAVLAALVLGLFHGARAFAYDFGLDLTNNSNPLSDQGYTIIQKDRATAWAAIQLGVDSDLYVSGFYEFSGTFTDEGASYIPLRLDFGRTEYSGSASSLFGPTSVLRWSVGRIWLSDFSGLLLSGLYDGARGELSIGNLSLSLSGSYTGLLYKEDALVYLDVSDAKVNADPSTYFAPRHALASLGARLSEVLPGQDFGIDTWGQLDLEGNPGTDGAYVEPFFEGSLGSQFKWRSWLLYEYSYDTSSHNALAAGALARFSAPELANLGVMASLDWASGPAGALDAFTPIMLAPLSVASVFTFSNAFSASVNLSCSPLRGLSTSLAGTALFRTSDYISGVDNLRQNPSGYYLGSEASANASVRVTSDMTLSALGGIFFPNTATYYQDGTAPRWTVTLTAAFSV